MARTVTRVRATMRAIFVASLLLWASVALAQDTACRASFTTGDGRSWTAVGTGRWSVATRTVERASCRSCVGSHTEHTVRAAFEDGPIEAVAFTADVVGGRTSFTLGAGGYPARSNLSVTFRGETDPVELTGTVELEGHHLRYRGFEAPRAGRVRELAVRFE